MTKKAKGPKWGECYGNDDVESRKYTVTRNGLERPSSRTVYFDCPFCGFEVKAYLWSISGGGKRCTCGALFGTTGVGYHFKHVEHRLQP